MTDLPRLSIRLDGSMDPSRCVALARAAEEAGLAGVWFAENAFERGVLPAAAACAVSTSRIRINAGVFNPFSRHPAMMAMEIGALDELCGGRCGISVGAGIASATAKLGLEPSKPVPALRDTLAILRSLLDRGEVDYKGSLFSALGVRLGFRARAGIPIFLAGRGALSVKLAGEAADGLIVSNMCSVAFAGKSAAAMEAARAAAGRNGGGAVVQYMPASIDADREKAIRAGARAVGEMLPRFWALGEKIPSARDAILDGTDIDAQAFEKAAAQLRGGAEATEILDERIVTSFSLSGTPNEALVLAKRYRAGGVSELALTFDGEDAENDIAALGHALAEKGDKGEEADSD